MPPRNPPFGRGPGNRRYLSISGGTPLLLPLATTLPATLVTATSANLNGSVDPEGNAALWGVTNLLPNPSVEYDTIGTLPASWGNSGGFLTAGATVTASADVTPKVGSKVVKVVTTASANEGAYTGPPVGGVLSGLPYTASFWARGASGGETINVIFGDAGGFNFSQSSAITLTASWQLISLTWTPNANYNSSGSTGIFIRGNVASIQTFYVDAAQVTQTSTVQSYGDGDQVGYSWLGTPGASASRQSGTWSWFAYGPGYSSLVRSDSPTSYWRLDESSGSVAADQIGANPGTYTPAPVTASQTNLVPNPSFEYDVAGSPPATVWQAAGAYLNTGATATVVTTQPFSGSQCCQVVTTNALPSEGIRMSLSATVGQTYTFSIYVRGNAGGEALVLACGGGVTTEVDTAFSATTSWGRYSVTITAAATELISLTVRTQGSSAYTYFVDAAMVVTGSFSPAYFDGDIPGCSWAGVPGASTSTKPLNWPLGQTGALGASGDSDTAAAFDGIQQRISIPNSASLQLTGALTLEAWVYQAAFPASAGTVFAREAGGIAAPYELIALSNGIPQLRVGNSSTETSVSGSTAIPLHTWVHLAVTVDGSGNVTHYLNGAPNGTGSVASQARADSGGQLGIGAQVAGSAFAWPWNGLIDEPAIYPTALSATEIAARYAAGTSRYAYTSTPVPVGSGTIPITLGLPLTGLRTGATYDYAIVAQDAAGTVYGVDQSFVPAAPAPSPTPATVPNTTFVTVAVPHLAYPFQMHTNGAVVYEQGETTEVLSCVRMIADCFQGACPELPDLGIRETTFSTLPLNASGLVTSLLDQEPRADETAVAAAVGTADLGVQAISVQTSVRG